MRTGMNRFPDPYQSRTDVSHATVFLIVVLLIIAIAAILFFGNAWVFAPPNLSSISSLTSVGSPPQAVSTQGSPVLAGPTFTAPTPAPPLAGVPVQAKPSMTATPAKPGQATPTPPGPAVTPTPSLGSTGVVANTGGDGVYLRHTPHLADRWVAWPDNTPLKLLGPVAQGDGQSWVQVRDPRGDVGWVPVQYVRH